MSFMSEALVGRGIRCLLFDLGDTLWYREDQDGWEKLEGASNQHAIELLRQHIDPALLPKLDNQSLGQQLRQAFEEQIRVMIRCEPLLEPDPVQAIASALLKWGLVEVNRSLCASLFEALRVRIPNSRPLFSDALPTLAELRRRGYLLGIVTNRLWGGRPFHEDLQSIGLLEYFDPKHIAISGDLGIRKPNPRIFEYALNSLQVSPRETAMIGDSLSADVLGSQPLGIYAIWKPKPWLSKWAVEHAASRPELATVQRQPVSPAAFPGEDTADTQIADEQLAPHVPPGGILATDDDYILAHANTSRDYLEQFSHGEIRPDCVIARLADLLEIFPQAGRP
jgi:FMN phosphatase YigB (HAD superfamily)